MMKFGLVFIAIFGIAYGTNVRAPQPRNLNDDLQDFLKLIPKDKILAIALEYLANDQQVQEAVEYMLSEEFKNLVLTVDSQPQVKELLNFLEASGLNAYEILNRVHELLGLPPINPRSGRQGRSIQGLIDDIKAILPVEEIKALYNDKLQTSPDFQALIKRLSSDEFHNFVLGVRALPEVQKLEQRLRDYGVDVDAIIDLVKKLLGWSRTSPRDLKDDLNDFLALLPQNKILAIALDYLANDQQVKDAVAYLQTEEFKTLLVTVDSQPEVKQLLNFLQSSGLNAYDLLNLVHDLLGLPHVEPREMRRTGGVQGLIDDIKAVLPTGDIVKLFVEKLQTSPQFRDLVSKLSSVEFREFVSRVRALPEAQRLEQRLRDYGVNVDAILDLLKKLFGWGRM